MIRVKDTIFYILMDAAMLMLSWYGFYFLRFEVGFLEVSTAVPPANLFLPGFIVAIFWLTVLTIFGMYKNLYLISRFDELIRILKITLAGTLILFFILFIDNLGWTEQNIHHAKSFTLMYWAVVFTGLFIGRMIVHTVQIIRIKKGKGVHKAFIVGTGEMALNILDNLHRHKLSGMNVIGFITRDIVNFKILQNVPVLGVVDKLNELIREYDVRDVIVALEDDDSKTMIKVLDEVDVPDVSVKIVPNFYQMISGLNRTNQIFGLPLIEVMPDPMPTWEKFIKRVLDFTFSILILTATLPIFFLTVILIKTTSSGPAIFSQKRVGLLGKVFTIYKFRTMFVNAEESTGPVWAAENDPRITPLGQWLRKLRMDELPQLFNVLKGEMSLVGPRPERPYFVEQFKKEIPLYNRRLRVKPGITGWAQVKWKYDQSFEDVVEKTKYDLFYVENMSLRMDLKILINTILTVIRGKGQ